MLVVAVALLAGRGRRLRWAAGFAGLIVLAPVVFPVLCSRHEYYLTAVAVLPMMAAGLVFRAALNTVSWQSAAGRPGEGRRRRQTTQPGPPGKVA